MNLRLGQGHGRKDNPGLLRVWGLGFMVQGVQFMVYDLWFMASLGFGADGPGCMLYG